MTRQAGWTSNQMTIAPKRAVYVWPTRDHAYPRALAASLGRTDLRIVGTWWLSMPQHGVSGIIIDHACELTREQFRHVEGLRHDCEVSDEYQVLAPCFQCNRETPSLFSLRQLITGFDCRHCGFHTRIQHLTARPLPDEYPTLEEPNPRPGNPGRRP